MPPKLKALLIDLNGTLHVGPHLTPRAAGAIDKLRRARIPFVFCSNSTKESEAILVSRLNDMGLKCTKDEVITSLGACRALVESRNLRPYLLLSPDAAEEFASVDCSPPHNAVVLGLYPPGFGYDALNTAFRILKREPLNSTPADSNATAETSTPVLIAPHKAAYHQAPATSAFPAGLSLGIGAYVRALEEAAGVEAQVVGKPTRGFYELAMRRMEKIYGIKLGSGNDGVAIIGDDVRNDLGAGALELGLKRILVRTGKYRPGAEEHMEVPPDAVYDTFADLVDELLGHA